MRRRRRLRRCPAQWPNQLALACSAFAFSCVLLGYRPTYRIINIGVGKRRPPFLERRLGRVLGSCVVVLRHGSLCKLLGLRGECAAYQQVPFNNEPSSGPIELKLFSDAWSWEEYP